MGKQYLFPVKDTEDATAAIARVSDVAQPGDEVVLVVISEVPEGEYIGDAPPAQVLDPLATTGGVSSEPRAAHDQPVFLSREEMMDVRAQELRDAINPQIAALHDRGFEARADAIFSDDPDAAITDYAGDIDATAVYMTREFYDQMGEDTRSRVNPL